MYWGFTYLLCRSPFFRNKYRWKWYWYDHCWHRHLLCSRLARNIWWQTIQTRNRVSYHLLLIHHDADVWCYPIQPWHQECDHTEWRVQRFTTQTQYSYCRWDILRHTRMIPGARKDRCRYKQVRRVSTVSYGIHKTSWKSVRVLELRKCACKTGCKKGNCSWFKHGLLCTPLCKCYHAGCENPMQVKKGGEDEDEVWFMFILFSMWIICYYLP